MSDVPPEGRMVVEIRHCCTYVPEGDQWIPAPGQAIEVAASVPVVVDVPHISGLAEVGGLLHCTMGNWEGEPTSYEYRWASNDMANAGIAADYVVVDSDVGKTITCVVTATNVGGSTTAPPSNAITIPAAGGMSAQSAPVNPARARREAVVTAPAPEPAV